MSALGKSLNLQAQILKVANETLKQWGKGELSGQEITDLLVIAKENGDWVTIAGLASCIACIYDITGEQPEFAVPPTPLSPAKTTG